MMMMMVVMMMMMMVRLMRPETLTPTQTVAKFSESSMNHSTISRPPDAGAPKARKASGRRSTRVGDERGQPHEHVELRGLGPHGQRGAARLTAV